MKTLVTGATGFIGSHLVESLVGQGHEVTSFVKPGSDASFVEDLGSKTIYGDVKDMESLKKACRGVDAVYHLAAIAMWDASFSNDEYEQVNAAGTRNVLEAARCNGVEKVLFTSSLEASGPSINGNPVDENTAPRPRNIYGKTKLEAERIISQYCSDHDIQVFTIRLPMVYGPRNMLHLNRYFKVAQRGFYPVVGDGSALMEFCYIKNVINAIHLVVEKGESGQVYFVSEERSYEFREVISAIGRELGVNVKYIRMPVFFAKSLGLSIEILSKIFRFYPFTFKATGRPTFSRGSVTWMAKSTLFCDISKVKSLGYHPPYNLKEGIKETVEWYRQKGVL